MVRVDGALAVGLVHHVAFDGAIGLLVFEGGLLLVDALRGLANARIALQIEIAGGSRLGVMAHRGFSCAGPQWSNGRPPRGFLRRLRKARSTPDLAASRRD